MSPSSSVHEPFLSVMMTVAVVLVVPQWQRVKLSRYRCCQEVILRGMGAMTGQWIKHRTEATWPKHVDACHVYRRYFWLSLVPQLARWRRSHRADCSSFLSPMHFLGIRSRSQKRSDRPHDSNSASNSSSRPPLLPQTNLALSAPEDTSSSSSSFSDILDVAPSKHPLGSKISHCEPDEPK